MLNALLTELIETESLSIFVFRDQRFPPLQRQFTESRIHPIMVSPQDNFNHIWQTQIAKNDVIWPIAPETGGILHDLCENIENLGRRCLSSPSEAVALTSSKIRTLNHLSLNNIPVVPTLQFSNFEYQFDPPWILKPDDGVGCDSVHLVQDRHTLDELNKHLTDHTLIQPFLSGQAASLSVLFSNGKALLLSTNKQNIQIVNNRLKLTACTVNVYVERRLLLQSLVNDIAAALPSLWGYVGIDLIFHNNKALILEINPRLTTSFVGLQDAIGINTASMVINLLENPLPYSSDVNFQANEITIDLEANNEN